MSLLGKEFTVNVEGNEYKFFIDEEKSGVEYKVLNAERYGDNIEALIERNDNGIIRTYRKDVANLNSFFERRSNDTERCEIYRNKNTVALKKFIEDYNDNSQTFFDFIKRNIYPRKYPWDNDYNFEKYEFCFRVERNEKIYDTVEKLYKYIVREYSKYLKVVDFEVINTASRNFKAKTLEGDNIFNVSFEAYKEIDVVKKAENEIKKLQEEINKKIAWVVNRKNQIAEKYDITVDTIDNVNITKMRSAERKYNKGRKVEDEFKILDRSDAILLGMIMTRK